MLNMNPGLKEITHSITGGALAAQGTKHECLQTPHFLTKIFRILDALFLRTRCLYDLLRTHSRRADPHFRPNVPLIVHPT
jgi:hypothetical protein